MLYLSERSAHWRSFFILLEGDMTFAESVPLDHDGAAELIQRNYAYMLSTRPEKYGEWVRNIERFKTYARIGSLAASLGLRYFKDAPARVDMIEALYIALRLVDDAVDGDSPLPKGWNYCSAYLDDLIAFVRRPNDPLNEVEHLLAYAFGIGRDLEMDLRRPVLDIIGSLRFDAMRRRQRKLYIPRQIELDKHFYHLDIRGTIGGCLMVMRETRVTYRDLEQLGKAVRMQYDVRDLVEDMQAKLCNITLEDVFRFHIRDVRDLASPRIHEWRLAKAAEGLRLLREFRTKKRRLPLHPFTRKVLKHAYEIPAEEFLQGVLSSN